MQDLETMSTRRARRYDTTFRDYAYSTEKLKEKLRTSYMNSTLACQVYHSIQCWEFSNAQCSNLSVVA